MSALRVCDACSRHVREDACPFCGALGASRPVQFPRVARAVLAAVALTSVAATASCFGAYGGPPPDEHPQNANPQTIPDGGTE